MKLLVDAQLPRRLAQRLREAGHEATHTLDLPLGNRTTDAFINELSIRERRVVVTKDSDFVNSFLLRREPSGSQDGHLPHLRLRPTGNRV